MCKGDFPSKVHVVFIVFQTGLRSQHESPSLCHEKAIPLSELTSLKFLDLLDRLWEGLNLLNQLLLSIRLLHLVLYCLLFPERDHWTHFGKLRWLGSRWTCWWRPVVGFNQYKVSWHFFFFIEIWYRSLLLHRGTASIGVRTFLILWFACHLLKETLL